MKPNEYNYKTKNGVMSFLTGPLSQWWGGFKGQSSNFTFGGITFNCAEQWMMFQKAMTFNDHEVAQEILQTKSPSEMQSLGRKIKPFDPEAWTDIRQDVVFQGNLLKFESNPDLKEFLLNTAPNILVEANPNDSIWGCGSNEDDETTYQPDNWQGKNLLGEVLTDIRAVLIASAEVEITLNPL